MKKPPTTVTVQPAKPQISAPTEPPASPSGTPPQGLGPVIPQSGGGGSNPPGKKGLSWRFIAVLVLLIFIGLFLATTDSPRTDEMAGAVPPTPTPMAEQAPLVIQGDGSETIDELLREGAAGAQDALGAFHQEAVARLKGLNPDQMLAVFAKDGWQVPDNDTTGLLQGGKDAMERNQAEQGAMFENCPPPPESCQQLGLDGWWCFQFIDWKNKLWQMPESQRGSSDGLTTEEWAWRCPP